MSKRSWDLRARANARFYIDSNRLQGTWAEFYDRGRVLVESIIPPALANIGAPSGGRILEIGCGAGRLMPGLANYFEELWGLDISATMLDLGRQFCPVEVHWVEGNGRDLENIPTSSFDYVLSYVTLQHVPSAALVASYLNEAARVVRPGGIVQLHLRSDFDSFFYKVLARSSTSFQALAGGVMRRLPQRRIDGDFPSWVGSVFPEGEALARARACGLSDARILADPTHPNGARYWLVGRGTA